MTQTPDEFDKRPRDTSGRVSPVHMTQRELLEEIVTNMRTVNDVVEELAQNPMISGMMGSGSGGGMASLFSGR